MVHILFAIALVGGNTYTGVTTVIGGISTVAGKSMTGGAQLYQPTNMLYFRTATTQWSSTDEISLKMAGGTLAPVAILQKALLTDQINLTSDLDKVTSTKDAYKAALTQFQSDLEKHKRDDVESDTETVRKAQILYDNAVAAEQKDRKTGHADWDKLATASSHAISQLVPMLDGLISSGKAQSF